MSVLTSAFAARDTRYMRWIDRRIPAAQSHVLSRNNLFIFPTLRGLVFILAAIVMWVLGTNYQNNLVLALAFFMFALLVVAILLTFNNLSGLSLHFIGYSETFADDLIRCRFALHSENKRWVDALNLSWQHAYDEGVLIDVAPDESSELSFAHPPKLRGVHALSRLRVESVYPFGLVKCWTWLGFDQQVVIFPAPVSGEVEGAVLEGDDGDGVHAVAGIEDFDGLRTYVPGDRMQQVAWKALARTQDLVVKDFSQSVSKNNYLDFYTIHANSTEKKLSIMCFWVLQYYQKNTSYGVNLPALKISPGQGFDHRTRCLTALAQCYVSDERAR